MSKELLVTIIGFATTCAFLFICLMVASASDLANVTAIQLHLDSGGCIQASDVSDIQRLNKRIAFAHGGGVSSWSTVETGWNYTKPIELRICK